MFTLALGRNTTFCQNSCSAITRLFFFEKCFNGPFKEGQTQKLELPEDRVEFFEIMIEFMLHGKVENVGSIHEFNLNSTATEDKNEFIEFIKYNDKYGLGEISDEAQQEFSELLVDKVDVSDIEVVFGASCR